MKKNLLLAPILLTLWVLLYSQLHNLSTYFVHDLLQLPAKEHITESLQFFVFEVPKVFLLLVLVVFIVGVLRTWFSATKTRKALQGKSLFTGNIMAAALGIVTPFCSCSAVPLFIGFVEAGIPIGVTFSFLIAAPLVNEIAVILLWGIFGWKITFTYVATGLAVAIFSGWLIGVLKLEKYVADWVYTIKTGQADETTDHLTISQRIQVGYTTVHEIVGKIWLYIVAGIAIGAAAHGYIPENYLAEVMNSSNWYSVPLAILIGLPLYSNAAGVIPIVGVLLEKGVSIGTALAFMMSVIGLSLPEVIILKKVLKPPLIIAFVVIVAVGIILVGVLFNLLF